VTVVIVAADELGTIVGLPDQIAERDATALEVLLNASGEDRTGSRGTALGKSPEQQTAAYLASRVLDGGQIEGLGLRPVAGNIVEILGVGGDLLKDAPGGFLVCVVISTVDTVGWLWDCRSVSLLLGTIMLDGSGILGHASIN
jgi:hypothetical protein